MQSLVGEELLIGTRRAGARSCPRPGILSFVRERIPRDWSRFVQVMVIVWMAVALALIVLAVWTWTHDHPIVN